MSAMPVSISAKVVDFLGAVASVAVSKGKVVSSVPLKETYTTPPFTTLVPEVALRPCVPSERRVYMRDLVH